MQSHQVRQSFIDFFAERGHLLRPSAPLVAHGDATLLFTNAGMVPFKNFFLGVEEPPAPRAVSVQKCMRVSGKHNDLENVGPSHRHHTFFEMLGNFSFGDYFKAEAIQYGWELVTGPWGLPPERLFATVFERDDEAAELWRKISGLPEERILRCGEKDNFWSMGETGPCGPCSEIFVDMNPELAAVDWEEGSDSGRYLEIWNLVFMQFERRADGNLEPLPDPSIDTGAGLERVAATLQGSESNYASDLFQPILKATAALVGTEYGAGDPEDVDLRVIADHLRAVTFLLADGVIPASDGCGYVLRRLLRRAVRHGMNLGFEEPFLHRLLPVVTETLGGTYPELAKAQSASGTTVEAEEQKFLGTLAVGSKQVQVAIDELRATDSQVLPGATLFRLYDTYGLPLELIEEIAEEEQFTLDRHGFERELEQQRKRSRAAGSDSQAVFTAAQKELAGAVDGATRYSGYSQLHLDGTKVLGAVAQGDSVAAVDRLATGVDGVIVLTETPFYAESGGQLGDRGRLAWPGGSAEVVDTRKDEVLYYHFVHVTGGELAVGQEVEAVVDEAWRRPTERNHTATHLLHAALRHVLGDGVRQAGSLVAPDRLRFDFTHGKPLADEQIRRVEDLVNRWILAAEGTEIVADRSFEEAVEQGAMALFGEKYGDRVRTVAVPPLTVEEGELRSLELCGGCHVRNTGQIGPFFITAERGVASGVRRIEARTGEGARQLVLDQREILNRLQGELEVAPEELPGEVAQLKAGRRELEKELADLRVRLVAGRKDAEPATVVAGVNLVVREVPMAPAHEIRNQADVVRNKLGSGVVVLGSRDDAKASLVVTVTDDLQDRLHAGRLAGDIAARVGGRGGGRADFAQAGGKSPQQLEEALAEVPALVERSLGESP